MKNLIVALFMVLSFAFSAGAATPVVAPVQKQVTSAQTVKKEVKKAKKHKKAKKPVFKNATSAKKK
jgi:hypothetical protein